MKRIRIGFLFCLIFLTACQPSNPQPSTAPAPIPAGLVVAISGDAALQREAWREFVPLAFGATMRRGDLVRVTGSSRAVVACSDFNLAEIAGGVKGFPCPSTTRRSTVFGGARVSAARGELGTEDYPVVLAPRKTRVLDARPRLRWTESPGAASYLVSVQGTDWQTVVSGQTELAYPDDAPALEPGKSYRVVVKAGDRSSLSEPGVDLGFTMATQAEAQQMAAEAAHIEALTVSAAAKRLLLSNLYAGNEFYADALQLLAQPAGADVPAFARLEGDIYLTVGLVRSAEAAYLAALAAATSSGDREGEALAARGLGTVYSMLGNPDEAKKYYRQARDLYVQVGDQRAVAELDAEMK